MTLAPTPASIDDPINAAILAEAEDRLAGFQPDPFAALAERTGLDPALIIERTRAMLEAGTVRRVRQTLLTTRLAAGALVAWQVPAERLDAAFDFMWRDDPFSGHVVIRSTDASTPGHQYRLWTTLKVPPGFSIDKHARYLAGRVGAADYRLLPAKSLFVLGVGHVRRREIAVGARTPGPALATLTEVVRLDPEQWRVLEAMKREFRPEELDRDLWSARAAEAGCSFERFCEVARALEARSLIGRFSLFLEHVKPHSDGQRVTTYNALFHWAVPAGMELKAGCEIGRHEVLTHAYWREAGPDFANVNLMGVGHGTDRALLLAHKRAIDLHLAEIGVPVSYTNVFWGGRSEIKPSEILPSAYVDWCAAQGIEADSMRV